MRRTGFVGNVCACRPGMPIGPTQLQVSNAEHRKILDAVTGGDAEGAGQAFEDHIMAGKQRVLDNLGSRGDNHERGYLAG